MIVYKTGNIFDSNCEALVNPVNCVGAMGAGLALQFKKYDFYYYLTYSDYCNSHKMHLGEVGVYDYNDMLEKKPDKIIISFPTKYHFRDKSRIEDIESGLLSLRDAIIRFKIQSIAIPKIGCGLGGLNWSDVKPLIEAYLHNIDCEIEIYE